MVAKYALRRVSEQGTAQAEIVGSAFRDRRLNDAPCSFSWEAGEIVGDESLETMRHVTALAR